MAQFKLLADIKKVNRYDFAVIADSKEEAKQKLIEYLNKNSSDHYEIDSSITCINKGNIQMEKVLSVNFRY